MVIYGEYTPGTGVLTNIRQCAGPVFPDDVPLVVMPTFLGPYGYDSVNQVATSTARTKRTLYAIRADLLALTTAQQAEVWSALIAGTPPLWATDAGANAAALAVLQLLGASATLSAADVKEAKVRAAAIYAQDNPTWLVHPVFDTSIQVYGDQPA